MKLTVRNFLGIDRAEMDIGDDIALVSGLNGAGKSSLLEAIGAVVTGDARVRSVIKRDLNTVVREGAESGSVTVDWGGGQRRIVFPSGEVKESGVPLDGFARASRVGLGLDRFPALSAADRIGVLTERFNLRPTRAHMIAWLNKAGVSMTPEELTALQTAISVSGWDAVHKRWQEDGTKGKGKWEQITKGRWGSKVIRDWLPAILVPGDDYDLASERSYLGELESRLAQMTMTGVVDQAKLAEWEMIAARGPLARSTAAELQSRTDGYRSEQSALVAERASIIDTADAHHALTCPGCKKMLRLEPASTNAPRGTLVALPTLTGDAIADARVRVTQIDERLAVLVREEQALNRQIATARAEAKAADNADHELVQAREAAMDQKAAAERAKLQRAVLDQREKVAAVDTYVCATEARDNALRQIEIAGMLSADKGVRAVAWRDGLAAINDRLADISETCGMSIVFMDEQAMPTYDGRPYHLVSASEKWRCDLAVAILLHEAEASGLPLLIDAFDILHPQSRGPLLRGLHTRGIPAVIAMTARDASTAPPLAKAGVGRNWWMALGVVSEASE